MARCHFNPLRQSSALHLLKQRDATQRLKHRRDRRSAATARTWAVVLAWIAVFALAPAARAQVVNTTVGPTFGIDDFNTLSAYSANTNYASPCPWVTSGWNTWLNGGGGGGKTWSLNWATGAAYTNSLAGVSIIEYDSNGNALPAVMGGTAGGAGTAGGWVVRRPATTQPNGLGYPAIPGPQDNGGQVVYVSYAPTAAQLAAGAPAVGSVLWLQAYSVTSNMPILTWNGSNSQLLDNGALPWNNARNQATPWYPTAGNLPAGTSAMADAPVITEPEPVSPLGDGPFTYNDQFQTFIATDTPNFNGFDNYVTIYGGVSWGFSFTSVDPAPEPSAMCFAGTALLSFLVFRRRRQAWRAEKVRGATAR